MLRDGIVLHGRWKSFRLPRRYDPVTGNCGWGALELAMNGMEGSNR